MHRLILIEREPDFYATWTSLIKKQQIPELSIQKITSRYSGFEGDLICFFEVHGNENDFKKILYECLKYMSLGSCFLLHVVTPPSKIPDFLKDQVMRLGYDIGVCEKESTVYSSIFHEILFGVIDELVFYKDLLNEHFLFPNRALAENYVKIHHEMSIQGKDVEDYMEMTIYEIWKYKNGSPK